MTENMKISTINALCGIIAKIDFKELADAKIRTTLYNDYYHLRRFVKQADEDRQEVVNKFQQDWKDELAAVDAFRKENKPVVGHDAYLEAERDANKAISDIFDAEAEVAIKPVKLDAFLSSYKGEGLNFEQIAVLQENGILEE